MQPLTIINQAVCSRPISGFTQIAQPVNAGIFNNQKSDVPTSETFKGTEHDFFKDIYDSKKKTTKVKQGIETRGHLKGHEPPILFPQRISIVDQKPSKKGRPKPQRFLKRVEKNAETVRNKEMAKTTFETKATPVESSKDFVKDIG